jgi:hypothetical protein
MGQDFPMFPFHRPGKKPSSPMIECLVIKVYLVKYETFCQCPSSITKSVLFYLLCHMSLCVCLDVCVGVCQANICFLPFHNDNEMKMRWKWPLISILFVFSSLFHFIFSKMFSVFPSLVSSCSASLIDRFESNYYDLPFFLSLQARKTNFSGLFFCRM